MGAVKVNAHVDLNRGAMDHAKERLRGAAERVHQHRAHVGILEDDGGQEKIGYDGKPTGATVAQVAMYHELNERSWLRTWFDQNLEKLKGEMSAAMRLEYQGDKDAVDRQALAWAADLRRWVDTQEGHLKALSTVTIEKKQAHGLAHPDVPLLATGQLVESIKAMLDGTVL
jgi:hypothetical protein